MTEIENKLAEYIATQVIKRPHYQLGSDDPLITSGLIDSFHLVDLAIFIEDTWGVRIDNAELNAATFDTLAQLSALVRQRQG